MEICHQLPGCIFTGYTENPYVNEGQPLPLFAPCHTVGKPDINTLNGWNITADGHNRQAFISKFGREPVDSAEMYNWVYSLTNSSTIFEERNIAI